MGDLINIKHGFDERASKIYSDVIEESMLDGLYAEILKEAKGRAKDNPEGTVELWRNMTTYTNLEAYMALDNLDEDGTKLFGYFIHEKAKDALSQNMPAEIFKAKYVSSAPTTWKNEDKPVSLIKAISI